ncbi:hypothetical protein E3N88_07239 [Mikania micrantha]|uniref:Uncharacterized protein n=1 Tax=Mikania micrantha TaxID=192012 RepID=A0A5N6PR01_9ASTR|nr:hypothetical protein E3N88_07239 [Mikania micrantha]
MLEDLLEFPEASQRLATPGSEVNREWDENIWMAEKLAGIGNQSTVFVSFSGPVDRAPHMLMCRRLGMSVAGAEARRRRSFRGSDENRRAGGGAHRS